MSQDEELRAIARAHALAPGDAGLALRHARALVRRGDLDGAEALLVPALDALPGDPDLTRELDALTGGRARGAPWPSPRGDAYRSGRSSAVGPSRGEVVERRELELDGPVRSSCAVVPSPGKALVATSGAVYEVTARGETTLLATLPQGLEPDALVLLPGRRLLVVGRSHAIALIPRETRRERVSHRYVLATHAAAGASGLLYVATRAGRVDAVPIAVPAEATPICRTEPDALVGLALAPGGDLLVAVEGSRERQRPARLERLGPRGERRFSVPLPAASLWKVHTQPLVDARGTTWLSFQGDRLHAIDSAGGTFLELPYMGEPAALAGESGEVLVLRDERTLWLVGDRGRGRPVSLGSAFFSAPRVDARGWVFAGRGDDLVGWDPAAPSRAAVEATGVAIRHWELVLAGEGRAFVFARVGGTTELVVVE